MESVPSVTKTPSDRNLTGYELNVRRVLRRYLVNRAASEFDYEEILLHGGSMANRMAIRREQKISDQPLS